MTSTENRPALLRPLDMFAGFYGPLLVAAAYYLGAQAAFLIGTLSDRVFAPFWPPNIILFCALLAVPREHWWRYIAFAFPAHTIAELGVGMETKQLLVAFVTNCFVVLLNALAVQRVLESPPWLGNFRKTLHYITITAGVSPAVAALGGAFVQILGGGSFDDYWTHWLQWYVANALGALTLGPVFLNWLNETPKWPLKPVSSRQLEAVLLALLLVVTCAAGLHFSVGAGGHGLMPVVLYLPLPFILWAAIRFGARGASGAILILTVVSIWCASRGASPFTDSSPEKSVLALQLFLIGISIPVLLLGAAVEQLRDAERAARELMGTFLRAHDQERRKFSRDLHDSTAQNLSAATLITARLQNDVPQSARPLFTQLDDLIQQSIRDLRNMSYLLYPPLLDESGLALALRSYVNGYAKRSGIAVELELAADAGRLPPDAELVLFRLAQETLGNFRQDSGGVVPRITLRRVLADSGESIVLTIDGAGNGTARKLGAGFLGIRERLRQIGGRLEVEDTGEKTVINAILPAPN